MGEELIFGKINSLLKNSGYPLRVANLNALRSFLGDTENRHLNVYDDIVELYEELVVGPGMW